MLARDVIFELGRRRLELAATARSVPPTPTRVRLRSLGHLVAVRSSSLAFCFALDAASRR
jgi:hypothetical protein